MSQFTRDYGKRLEAIVNSIPNNGCLLVFGVPEEDAFRQMIRVQSGALLAVSVCKHLRRGQKRRPRHRDYYITWREDGTRTTEG